MNTKNYECLGTDRDNPPKDVAGFYSLGNGGNFLNISYATHDMNLWQWPPPCINLTLNYRVDARKSSSAICIRVK
jgi:hypothetical protein